MNRTGDGPGSATAANTSTALSFIGAGSDDFAFDDFSIGALANVVVPPVPTGVPEAETVVLTSIGSWVSLHGVVAGPAESTACLVAGVGVPIATVPGA